MRRIITQHKKEVKYWVNAVGNEFDITEMSDEYVVNCIGFLQKKINTLLMVKNRSVILNESIKEMESDIRDLNKELDLRRVQDRRIARGEGVEDE